MPIQRELGGIEAGGQYAQMPEGQMGGFEGLSGSPVYHAEQPGVPLGGQELPERYGPGAPVEEDNPFEVDMKVNYSLNDARFVTAATIYQEARSEPDAALIATAGVINRRMQERGLSAKEVCLQPSQFSVWNGNREAIVKKFKSEGHLKNNREKEAWEKCLFLADLVLSGNAPNVSWNHMYSGPTPDWAVGHEDQVVPLGKLKFLHLPWGGHEMDPEEYKQEELKLINPDAAVEYHGR